MIDPGPLNDTIIPGLYMLAAAGFILAIKWMNSPATARRGVIVGEIGMLIAVVGTLLRFEVVSYQWIFIAFFLGSAIGVPLAYMMPMTAVPQRTAISHAFGALAAALIGTAEYYRHMPHGFTMGALVLETLLGFLTFTASLMAFGKLQELLPTRPMTYRGQNIVNLSLFGLLRTSAAQATTRPVHSATPEEAAEILDSARTVIVVPGYGMAVAQAQHKLRELFDALTRHGVDVKFAIHPVAGRMPGHMNVLLAEADVPYDKLFEMDDINPEFPMADVALVIGANDVVNPAARTDKNSPIAGMPILDADKARTVMVIKRSMNPGFAGIDNELYYMPHTLMLFGDAKTFVGSLVKELGALVRA